MLKCCSIYISVTSGSLQMPPWSDIHNWSHYAIYLFASIIYHIINHPLSIYRYLTNTSIYFEQWFKYYLNVYSQWHFCSIKTLISVCFFYSYQSIDHTFITNSNLLKPERFNIKTFRRLTPALQWCFIRNLHYES